MDRRRDDRRRDHLHIQIAPFVSGSASNRTTQPNGRNSLVGAERSKNSFVKSLEPSINYVEPTHVRLIVK
jgi:hypothetical protein